MSNKKLIFIAFASEDTDQRDLLKQQSLHANSPFEYVDMPEKEPYSAAWKERVRAQIQQSDRVIALVSKNSLTSGGQKWELSCAKEERKRVLGIWAYPNDRTKVDGVSTVVWSQETIEDFINNI
ncbi:MAG TPA: TIR domain-containing protein [Spirochaetales bacterium]|jgi:nucleoside 2-deoxyribosyltransferase|nr:TIR domain-containing protein [Spirochaetales bacterium]